MGVGRRRRRGTHVQTAEGREREGWRSKVSSIFSKAWRREREGTRTYTPPVSVEITGNKKKATKSQIESHLVEESNFEGLTEDVLIRIVLELIHHSHPILRRNSSVHEEVLVSRG